MTNQDTTLATSNGEITDSGLLLPGLDGTNPLGFLAALGLFRTITYAFDEQPVRMKWEPSVGTWVPRIVLPILTQEELLDLLTQQLEPRIEGHPAQLISSLKDDDTYERRALIASRVAEACLAERTTANWISAIASDIVPSAAINQLQTTRRDYFYRNLRSVMQKTNRDHLARSIFHSWDYADGLDNQSLHLDPSEDRRHAHQWNKPSGDPNRKKSGGMLGANRLAIEAIPLFTSLPETDSLRTLGFTGSRSADTRWTWPLWKYAISLNTTVSLLALRELQDETLDDVSHKRLAEIGIATVLRTYRILVGKTPNFTPARRIA